MKKNRLAAILLTASMLCGMLPTAAFGLEDPASTVTADVEQENGTYEVGKDTTPTPTPEPTVEPTVAPRKGMQKIAPRTAGTEGEMTGAELLAKAENGVITLTGDVTLTDNVVWVQDTLTLDLNGHTIYGRVACYKGDLTIKDSSSEGTGAVNTVALGWSPLLNNGEGGATTLTVEGGNFVAPNGVNSLYNMNGAVANIEGGDFEHGIGNGWWDGEAEGTAKEGNGVVNISGGTVQAHLFEAGDITVQVPAISNAAEVNISGEALIQSLNDATPVENYGTMSITGGTFQAKNVAFGLIGNYYEGTITIKDGTFTGEIENWFPTSGKKTPIEISGGTFNYPDTYSDKMESYLAANVKLENGVVKPRTAGDAGNVARVGEGENAKYYSSLQAAVDAAETGNTVTLLRDTVELSVAEGDLIIEKTLTVDLNGKKLNVTGVGTNGVTVQNNGNLTFRNGTIEANNVFKVNNPVIEVTSGASVTLDQVTMETDGVALYPRGDAAKVSVINGSSVSAPKSFAVATNAGKAENYNVIIELKDSTFNGNTPVLINVPGTLSVDNCEINGILQGALLRGGNIEIKNSTITQKYDDTNAETMANYFASRNWGDGNMANLAAVTIGNKHATAYQYPTNVIITDTQVTVKGDNEARFPCIYVWANEAEGKGVTLGMAKVICTGTHDPQIVYGNEQKNITVNSSVASVNGVGYPTLQAAIDAATAGQTVTLLKDVTLESKKTVKPITIAKPITLDLAGHLLTGWGFNGNNGGNAQYVTVEVVNGGSLIVKSSDEEHKGEIRGSNYYAIYTKGPVTIESGSVTNVQTNMAFNLQAILASGLNASVTVEKDAKVISTLHGIQAQLGANVTINGGTVRADGTAIYGLTSSAATHGTIKVNSGTVESTGKKDPDHPENLAAFSISSYNLEIHGGNIKGAYAVALDTYKGNKVNGNANVGVAGASTFTMTGGSIEAGVQAIGLNNLMSAGTTAEISGGTISAPGRTAIYWPAEGTLTIKGDAQISGGTGIEVKMGTVRIEGGTITGNGAFADQPPVSGGTAPEGSALLVSAQMYGADNNQYVDSPNLTVTISGGKLISEQGNGVTVYNTRENDVPAVVTISGETTEVTGAVDKAALVEKVAEGTHEDATTVEVSDGIYSSDVSAYCVEGFKAALNESTGKYGIVAKDYVAQVTAANGAVTKYETLQAAINAAEDGQTVTLLQNVEITEGILISRKNNLTLDGDNHTIAVLDNAQVHAIQAWSSTGVNIKDVTITGAGKDALLVNQDSTVTATNLTTSGNAGGAVNVDKNSSFTLVSGNLAEGNKIWADDAASTITVPEGWTWVQVGAQRFYTTGLSISLNQTTANLYSNITPNTVTLTVTGAPEGAAMAWASSNEAVATVNSDGLVTAVGAGAATITVTVGGMTASCTVTVNNATLTLSQTTLAMTVGYTVSAPVTLTATAVPAGEITWTSGNPAVATVVSGLVTPVAAGTATITASANGLTAECQVTVTYLRDPGDGGSTGGGSTGGGTTTPVTPPEEDLGENDTPLTEAPVIFEDVAETDWFHEAVSFVAGREIMRGVDESHFAPQMTTTRGMIVTILYRLEKEPEAAASAFSDVDRNTWYTAAVDWAAANGIVKGFEDGSFRPEEIITREQLAAILGRYASLKGYDKTLAGDMKYYNDKTLIGDWAVEEMTWAVGARILRGKGNSLLDPQGTATRAEAAEMLKNFCQAFVKETEEK